MSNVINAKVVVIGSGPGGYSCAFRLADLIGEGVVLVERYENLGGVCLNVGCIPSKALLHLAEIINESKHMHKCGITFGEPKIDINGVRKHKESILAKLTGGLGQMAKMRKVKVINGTAKFLNDKTLSVEGKDACNIVFENCVIAAGSTPVKLPFLPDDKRIMDSTGALELESIPPKLLVIGGGIIGLEMATVYHALGSQITVVELGDGIMPGADRDIVAPYYKRISGQYEKIMLGTKVVAAEAKADGIWVTFEGKDAPKEKVRFDKVLSAVGRVPNGKKLDAQNAGVFVDERGFIPVDKQLRTNVNHIFAIGDIVGNPMLAHKAIPEGRTCAEVISGLNHEFNPMCIPSVAYTDPEIAWVGYTEEEAKAKGINYGKGVFPMAACGRSLATGRDDGFTKVLFDKETHRVIGAGIIGLRAGDIIGEVSLAIEMGCEAEDIALTIHPHPTFAETIALATEVFEGTVTDLPPAKK